MSASAMDLEEFDAILAKDEAFLSQIDEELDYAFALSLQEEYKEVLKSETINRNATTSVSSSKPVGIVDEQWELLDPNPDIHALFLQYNFQFFWGKLDGVEVKWSPRMTLCAGVCSYEGRGGLCSVRLSLPLLKLRPRRDLVETLLHEMIHAYLFVTANNKDHNAHGPEFLKHMTRINKETGTKISVYHSFHDEVDLYRKHIWKCNGPCKSRRPFYGIVKRASNRAPNPRDFWWAQHQSSCGGTFIKIQEPEDYKTKNLKRKPVKDTSDTSSSIKKFFKHPTSEGLPKNTTVTNKNDKPFSTNAVQSVLLENSNVVNVMNDSSKLHSSSNELKNITPFTGKGFLLGSANEVKPKSFLASIRQELFSTKSNDQKQEILPRKSTQVTLPKEFLVKDEAKKPFSKKLNAQPASTSKDKNAGYVQSSLDKFVSSPSRSQGLSETQMHNSSPKVECPVCLQMFFNSDINAHLDSCLLK